MHLKAYNDYTQKNIMNTDKKLFKILCQEQTLLIEYSKNAIVQNITYLLPWVIIAQWYPSIK